MHNELLTSSCPHSVIRSAPGPLTTPQKIKGREELHSPCWSTYSTTAAGSESDDTSKFCDTPPHTPQQKNPDTFWGAVEDTLDALFSKHAFLVDGLEEIITAEHQHSYRDYLLNMLPPTRLQVQRSNLSITASEVEPIVFQVHLAHLAWKSTHDIRLPAGRDRVQSLLPQIKSGHDDGKFIFANNPLRLRMPTGDEHDIEPFELEADKGCFFCICSIIIYGTLGVSDVD